MINKETTIDDLAVLVQQGFEEVRQEMNEGFDEVRQEMNEGFERVEGELKLINGRLDAIETELIFIKKKLDNIIYRHEFEMLRDKVADLEKEIVAIGKKK